MATPPLWGLLQGEMVNRIEHNINQSSDYVEKAKENTEKAVTLQSKARKVRHQSQTSCSQIWILRCCLRGGWGEELTRAQMSLGLCAKWTFCLQKKLWIAICLAILIVVIGVILASVFAT